MHSMGEQEWIARTGKKNCHHARLMNLRSNAWVSEPKLLLSLPFSFHSLFFCVDCLSSVFRNYFSIFLSSFFFFYRALLLRFIHPGLWYVLNFFHHHVCRLRWHFPSRPCWFRVSDRISLLVFFVAFTDGKGLLFFSVEVKIRTSRAKRELAAA